MSVRVKFITRDEDLQVNEAPIVVPVDLKRAGLSEIVNQLLENSEPVNFDFLGEDGQLLRGSLEQHLSKNGLSSENVITLEYVRAIEPPTFMASFEHEDWISSAQINPFQPEGNIVTGSYDGIVRVWDRSGQVQHQFTGHQAAVTAAVWANSHKIVSGSRDRNVHIYNTEGKELSCVLRGHKSTVSALAVLKHEKIVSGSQDCTLRVWSTRIKDLPEYSEARKEPSKSQSSQKRRKLAEKALAGAKTRGSFATLEGHQGPVTDLSAHPIEPDVVYSCSEDHTVKTWDLVTAKCIDTKVTGFSLLSLASLGKTTQLLACGSSARHITLVDPRSSTHATVKQLNGHRNFVSSIAPNPKNGYQFASASHDGTVKLWDVRADTALHTIERKEVEPEQRDLYCVDWRDLIATGGRNKQLELTSSGTPTAA